MPDNATLKSLTKKRGGHRARCTTLTNDLNQAIDDQSTDLPFIQLNCDELRRQIQITTQLDDQISDLVSEDSLESEITEASQKAMQYNSVLSKAQQYMSGTTSTQQLGNHQTRLPDIPVKLPQLSLVKFSGDSLDWLKFWELFRESVHERTDIKPAVKFQYLVGQLQGDAANLISGFNHTSAEYTEAVELLKSTYGEPRILVQGRLNALFDIEPPEATVESLSNFRSTYEGHLRVLKSLNSNVTEAGYVYAHMLIRKLPPTTRDNINRAGSSDVWDLEELRKAINEEINHLTALQDASTIHKGNSSFKNNHSASFPINSNSGTNFKSNSNYNSNMNNKSASKTCPLCEGNHNIFRCKVYESRDSRMARATKLELCYNCLGARHTTYTCRSRFRCQYCDDKHHTALCTRAPKPDGKKNNNHHVSANAIPVNNSNETSQSVVNVASTSNKSTSSYTSLLPTANVTIRTPNGRFECKALLDVGSQRTFILKSLADTMHLKIIDKIALEIDGFASVGKRQTYDIVQVDVITSSDITTISALTVESMPSRVCMPGRSDLVKSLIGKGFTLADPSTHDSYNDLHMIIGIDSYHRFVPGNKVADSVYAFDSKLGSVIVGTIPSPAPSGASSNVSTVLRIGANIDSSVEANIHSDNSDLQIRKLWELDTIGMKDPSSDHDDLALQKFRDSVVFHDGKYHINLPWKDDSIPLQDNRGLAYKRMHAIWQKLSSNEKLLKVYHSIIQEQLHRGFIELVDDQYFEPEKVHYIPHHFVAKDSETTPLRIVYDCSAKQDKNRPSMNDLLLTGPCLTQDLTKILLNFRIKPFACVSDAEKAFLMVGLKSPCRDACRFFWPENPFDPNSKIMVYRFCVVLFGSTASQFLLNCTIEHHLAKYNCQAAHDIQAGLYVDNFVNTFQTENSMLEFYTNCKAIMAEGGFNVRQWIGNSDHFMKSIKDDDRCIKNPIKVLGVTWDVTTDKLYIKPNFGPCVTLHTKRSLISALSKVFDPYGFWMPLMVSGKLLIQEVWKAGLSWDEPLNPEMNILACALVKELSNFDFQISREVVVRPAPVVLHVFGDSSTKCFGIVAYISCNGKLQFLMSKSRLAPIKPPTLPQLELTALNFAARIAKFILESYRCRSNDEQVEISEINIWSDSEISLHWVHSKTVHKKAYVRHRVEDIRKLCPNAIFRHVDSKSNPADLITRGLTVKEFRKSETFWRNGPQNIEALMQTEFQATTVCSAPCHETHTEISIVGARNINVVETDEPDIDELTKVEDFSSFRKIARVIAYVKKFIFLLKEKLASNNTVLPNLSAQDIMESEILLISLDQRKHFHDILKNLRKSDSTHAITRVPALVYQLNLKYDGTLIRSHGRLLNSSMTDASKYPILLAAKSPLTRLIILDAHKVTMHSGTNYLLSFIREKYWIPRGRQVIKSIIHQCVCCRKVVGRAFKSPPEAPLPPARVSEAKPFQVSGVDLTGAIQVKDRGNHIKAYIVLFTCAVTRAIHLEIVYSLSAEDFLRSFIKFCSRRSLPQIIYSDNATYFVSVASTLKQISTTEIVVNHMRDNSVDWKFITPRASWHGGFWERLIGLTKNVFKKVVGQALLSRDDLETVVPQIEAVLNDRPLTYATDSMTDPQPLTPSQLIYGYKLREFPNLLNMDVLSDPTYGSKEILSKVFVHRTRVLERMFSRWKHEYLACLRERYRSKDSHEEIKPGQVVLISDDMLPRVAWKLGVITKIFKGSDGYIRSVQLRTQTGTFLRPVAKLFPLEVECIEKDFYPTIVPPPPRRSQRQAANRAIQNMRECS